MRRRISPVGKDGSRKHTRESDLTGVDAWERGAIIELVKGYSFSRRQSGVAKSRDSNQCDVILFSVCKRKTSYFFKNQQ